MEGRGWDILSAAAARCGTATRSYGAAERFGEVNGGKFAGNADGRSRDDVSVLVR